MAELQWTEEVAYILEYDGDVHKEILFVNGIDGKRYRTYRNEVESNALTSTTHESTGNEFQEIKAELIASRTYFENENRKSSELIYFLPDTGKFLHATHLKEGIYGHFGFGSLVY